MPAAQTLSLPAETQIVADMKQQANDEAVVLYVDKQVEADQARIR